MQPIVHICLQTRLKDTQSQKQKNMNLFNLLTFLPMDFGNRWDTAYFLKIFSSFTNSLAYLVYQFQNENAIWLYAGIQLGHDVLFLAKIVACYFCKGTNSQAKSHQPSSQEVPLLNVQPPVPVQQSPTTEQQPNIGTAPPAYMPKLTFSKMLQEN